MPASRAHQMLVRLRRVKQQVGEAGAVPYAERQNLVFADIALCRLARPREHVVGQRLVVEIGRMLQQTLQLLADAHIEPFLATFGASVRACATAPRDLVPQPSHTLQTYDASTTSKVSLGDNMLYKARGHSGLDAPRDCETRPATAVAWQRTDTAVSERGQRQRGGDPHPTAVGRWFAMRPLSQVRSGRSPLF